MKRGEVIELEIIGMAFGGYGFGHILVGDKKMVVYVDKTVPGDILRVQITGKKRRFFNAQIVEFIKLATNRIPPKCVHFEQCGGCSMQNLPYVEQLKIKQKNVSQMIKNIGRLNENIVKPILKCDREWFYRNKMEFSFDYPPEGKLDLGLHLRRRHHDVIEQKECYLMSDWTADFVVNVRDFFRSRELTNEPKLLSLVLREGKNTGEKMVNLICENGEATFLNEFKEICSGFNSVYYTNFTNIKGQPKSICETLLSGKPSIKEALLINNQKLEFDISPKSFFQPNTHQAQVLYENVIKAADLKGDEIVFDLYCGAGTIGLCLAHNCKKVYGIEIIEDAIKNARENAEKNNITNTEFICGDVRNELNKIDDKPDIVIIDPPRAGLHEDTISFIGSAEIPKIIYISCNPSTLARDLDLFSKTGYSTSSVQPVDMFPHTYHIESVAVLSKN
ncbi:23S rRNA (uracil(1939)-C(5))-methyltransferase RlmD [Candidatus Peregrinibacteria bacterium]|nr:23S rRNA (uracil(1939)-C(5))-methyltransferase RlmD [Candidatus Peregrinibacteria bacterium]